MSWLGVVHEFVEMLWDIRRCNLRDLDLCFPSTDPVAAAPGEEVGLTVNQEAPPEQPVKLNKRLRKKKQREEEAASAAMVGNSKKQREATAKPAEAVTGEIVAQVDQCCAIAAAAEHPIEHLVSAPGMPVSLPENTPQRLVICKQTDRAPVDALAARISEHSGRPVQVSVLVTSAWKGMLRNVPGLPTEGDVVSVASKGFARTTDGALGPILVLVGLKYSGNIGAVIRAAVQADCFEAIYIVKDGEEGKGEPAEGRWEVGEGECKRMDYYSMHNAPLIDIRRFESCVEFLTFASEEGRERRKMVGVDGGTTFFGKPDSLYSNEALLALASCGYIAMGSEDRGLPDDFLRRCNSLVMIPCLSASINVASAFSGVLTVMQLAMARPDLVGQV